MMKKLSMRLLFTFFLSISTTAHADVFHLQFNDEIYGGHQTLDLQNELHDQYQVDASHLYIDRIAVVIKSLFGGGQIWLGSRYSQNDRRFVNGQAGNFNNPADWTFNQVTFPKPQAKSGLQLHLNGQFRLREVAVYTQLDPAPADSTNGGQDEAYIALPMHHLELNGLNSVDIKQLLRNDTRLNPDDFHLNSIMVALKSGQDGAQAWLESGGLISELVILHGAAQGFDSHELASYDYRSINAVQYTNEALPWVIKFNGDIRLYEIVINLAKR